MKRLSHVIGDAVKAGRDVSAARLTYDAARATLKSARPERASVAKTEMEKTEDEFVNAVEKSMSKMKDVVRNGEALQNLADLCAAQLTYFKTCYEAMAELSPEIDELQV
jgi:hypothetical protein